MPTRQFHIVKDMWSFSLTVIAKRWLLRHLGHAFFVRENEGTQPTCDHTSYLQGRVTIVQELFGKNMLQNLSANTPSACMPERPGDRYNIKKEHQHLCKRRAITVANISQAGRSRVLGQFDFTYRHYTIFCRN